MAAWALCNNADAANMKALTDSRNAAQRGLRSPLLLPTMVCTAAVLSCVQGGQRLCWHWQAVCPHLGRLEEQNHWCCGSSIRPTAYACPMDWPPTSTEGTYLILCHTMGPQVPCYKTAAWHTPRAQEVPWEMHLKTSHQTEGLTRLCAEKDIGCTKDRHIVS